MAIALAGAPGAGDVFPPIPVTRARTRAIPYLKARTAATIERTLPAVPFERFVSDTFGSGAEVAWATGTCNMVLPRVVRESALCVEVTARSAGAERGATLFVRVGSFGGLEAPRLESGEAWRATPDGRETVWLSGLAQLAALGATSEGRPSDAIVDRMPEVRAQLALIDSVQALPASSLRPTLPETRLGTWAQAALGREIQLGWRVSDCDLKDAPDVCVMMEARHPGGAWGKIHVRTGTATGAWSGQPEVMDNSLLDCPAGTCVGAERLGEFFEVLARPPRRDDR
jgi:hypothetical protein